MNELDLAYAAGFLDGEGCFEIIGSPSKSCIRVKMANSNKEIVYWFQKMFGGSVYDCGVRSKKHIWSWGVNGEDALRVCELLQYFLKEKRPQAETLIEFRNLGVFNRYNKPSEDILQKRKELKERCQWLKSKH